MTDCNKTLNWFFTCYFNESCHENDGEIVDRFFKDESAATVLDVRNALFRLKNENLGETELENLLDTLGCAYYPPGAKKTYRQWLDEIDAQLVEATKQKEEAEKPAPPPPDPARGQRSHIQTTVGEVLWQTVIAVLLGVILYPVIGVGGCVTRVMVGGTPPPPSSPAHDVWLNSPVKSWTTEAILLPLLFVSFAFLAGLVNLRRTNPEGTIVLFLLFLVAAVWVGVWFYNLNAPAAAPSKNRRSSQMRGVPGNQFIAFARAERFGVFSRQTDAAGVKIFRSAPLGFFGGK